VMPVNPSVALLVVGFFGAPDVCSWFVISFSVLLGCFGFGCRPALLVLVGC
jgi:hypothetical protein